MKAVIPVAGAGTQLRPHTYTHPKPLIPVAGKPIISFIVDSLIEVGIRDFIFVIGYMGDKIEAYIKEKYPLLHTEFVVQQDRKGLGHAIYVALESVEEDGEIFIALGDTICELDLQKMIDSEDSCIAISKVADPRGFGVVEIDPAGRVHKVSEKPRIPTSNQAIVGMYKINSALALKKSLEYIIAEEISTHGEFQLTDGLMEMIKDGHTFSTIVVEKWFDCGKKDILLETNALLLEKNSGSPVERDRYKDTIIIEPVHIGKDCDIECSIIGPYVSISDGVKLERSILRNSIIGEYSTLEEVVLVDSVIGNDTAIKGIKQSLNLGDNTQIDFSA